MMTTTMGYNCECGSVLKSKGKRNILNHKNSHKHKKWQFGSDYKKTKPIEIKVVYTMMTYGKCKID